MIAVIAAATVTAVVVIFVVDVRVDEVVGDDSYILLYILFLKLVCV